MGQIAQQGKTVLEITEKYEVPKEYYDALWAAYEAGAEMGFWKAATTLTDLASYDYADSPDVTNPPESVVPTNTHKEPKQ